MWKGKRSTNFRLLLVLLGGAMLCSGCGNTFPALLGAASAIMQDGANLTQAGSDSFVPVENRSRGYQGTVKGQGFYDRIQALRDRAQK